METIKKDLDVKKAIAIYTDAVPHLSVLIARLYASWNLQEYWRLEADAPLSSIFAILYAEEFVQEYKPKLVNQLLDIDIIDNAGFSVQMPYEHIDVNKSDELTGFNTLSKPEPETFAVDWFLNSKASSIYDIAKDLFIEGYWIEP